MPAESPNSEPRTVANCLFCSRIASGELIAQSDVAAAFWDVYPVSPGHALIVPRRHEADFFRLSATERDAMMALLTEVKVLLDRARSPAGYNVGINAGAAAGQTVDHAHLHLIPRFIGDTPDPRGGIRWVVPAKAAYW